MKIYRDASELLAEIERLLTATRPSFRRSPLQEVIELLSFGRHYTWMGVYLAAGATNSQLVDAGRNPLPAEVATPETKTKILVSIKLAGRELGLIDVESDRENALRSQDRVLLENVADRLARFLAGPGRYISRKARMKLMAPA